jgi:heme exporter protein A
LKQDEAILQANLINAECVAACRADRTLFRDVTFRLGPGEAQLVTGPNGSGKSTLLRILASLRLPDAGRLSWRGEDIRNNLAGYARSVAYLGHQNGLKPGLTALQNLRLFPAASADTRRDAMKVLDLLPLADIPVRMLSAGQARQVALARIMQSGAPIWLLDEPATALDSAATQRLLDLIAVRRTQGGVVVAVTHQRLPMPGAAELRLA